MKLIAIFSSLIIICLVSGARAFAQQGCDFQVAGTWRLATSDETGLTLYRFAPDGIVTVLSRPGVGSELREVASATYKLDNPQSPKLIEFTAIHGSAFFPQGKTSFEISSIESAAFSANAPGSPAMRWVKVEAHRYFIALVACNGSSPYGESSFGMLMETDGRQTQVDTMGLYFDQGRKIIGPIPAKLYNEFMNDARTDSDIMLRLEITGAEFARIQKIMQTWQRRAREGALLYAPGSQNSAYFNDIVLLKEIVESLNQCGEKIKLHKLDWGLGDEIAVNYNPRQIPFQYIKKLRMLNDALHVADEKFHK